MIKITYDVMMYIGIPYGKPYYQEFNTGFTSLKAAKLYASENKTLQEKGYKIVRKVK